MKKYLLIPIFFIAALAIANAGCGGCPGDAKKSCDKESKEECSTEKKGCCGTEKSESSTEEESTQE